MVHPNSYNNILTDEGILVSFFESLAVFCGSYYGSSTVAELIQSWVQIAQPTVKF